MLREPRSTSTNTAGRAGALDHVAGREEALCRDDDLVARADASSSKATCIAAVAEVSVRTGRLPKRSDNAFSNAATRGPVAIQRLRKVSATAAIMASSMVGRAKGRKSTRIAQQGTLPATIKAMPTSFCAVSDSPNRYQAATAFRTYPIESIGIGDRNLDARQAHDPDHQAHDVAREPAGDVRLEGELHADGDDVLRAVLELPHRVGARLEQPAAQRR